MAQSAIGKLIFAVMITECLYVRLKLGVVSVNIKSYYYSDRFGKRSLVDLPRSVVLCCVVLCCVVQ